MSIRDSIAQQGQRLGGSLAKAVGMVRIPEHFDGGKSRCLQQCPYILAICPGIVRFEYDSDTPQGLKPQRLLTLLRKRFPEKCGVATTQVEAVVGEQYLTCVLPSQTTHPERCHARSSPHALQIG
jgi:hypothetical protein